MRLWGASDLHVGYADNRDTIEALPDQGDDWLIVGGDVGETVEQLQWCLTTLGRKFGQLIWVPGNHELYTVPKDSCQLTDQPRYLHLVEVCRQLGVLTPEDPFPEFPGQPGITIAPLFLLYDYSFAPDGLDPDAAKKWAREDGIWCADERYIDTTPYATMQDWCAARLEVTRGRLAQVPDGQRLVLINHWPLRRDLVRLFRIPRFVPWCGTRVTEDWHLRYPVECVVSGHLHMRATDWRDGVRFEEVSLGYPRHWRPESGLSGYLREILPGPGYTVPGHAGPEWHR